MCDNWQLDSASPGHTEPSDQSAVKKTDDDYQGKRAHVKLRLNKFCVQMITDVTSTVCSS